MNSKNLGIFVVIGLLVFSVTVAASMIITPNNNAKENSKGPENSPVIGENWDLQRVNFIHYAKPDKPGKPSKGGGDSCYKLMGIRWNFLPVDYVINPINPYGLSEEFVTSTISTSAETWDDATSIELVNNAYGIDNNATMELRILKMLLILVI